MCSCLWKAKKFEISPRQVQKQLRPFCIKHALLQTSAFLIFPDYKNRRMMPLIKISIATKKPDTHYMGVHVCVIS